MTSLSAAGPRVAPLALDDLPAADRAQMEHAAELMGFMPNDGLLMARVPGMLPALSALVAACYTPGALDMASKRLVAVMSSEAAGCRYCQAHTRFGARRQGISPGKLDALWSFETSAEFSAAERAALKFSWLASLTPNQAGDEEVAALKKYYSEQQILEITAVIALFGFLNRWNDTLKTTVEDQPAQELKPL